MDHFFEQKLVNENNKLQLEVVKANKQIAKLMETVRQYETILASLNETDIPDKIRLRSIKPMSDIPQHDIPQHPKSVQPKERVQKSVQTSRTSINEITSAEARGPKRELAVHHAERLARIIDTHNATAREKFEGEINLSRMPNADPNKRGSIPDSFVTAQQERAGRIADIAMAYGGARLEPHAGAAGTVHQFNRDIDRGTKFFQTDVTPQEQNAAKNRLQIARNRRIRTKPSVEAAARRFGF